MRFLDDEISQRLDVGSQLQDVFFCGHYVGCVKKASEDIYIFTQHLGYGQGRET